MTDLEAGRRTPRPLNPNGYGWQPTGYTATRATGPVLVDGDLTKPVWQGVPRTSRFVHLVTGEPAPLDTTAAVIWDEQAMYVGFWVAEPQVTATMTDRDALLFYENDVEVFVAGSDCYYELEVNALGVVYEVFYVWRDAHRRGSRWDDPRWDVHHPRVHSFAGDHGRTRTSFWDGNHPRGTRWAYLEHDLPGLQVAVRVDGAVNDPRVVDTGWTCEIALPWSGLVDLAGERALPPAAGDTWSLFLGRFQQTVLADGSTAGVGSCVSPHGIADTHIPESFTRVTFADDRPATDSVIVTN